MSADAVPLTATRARRGRWVVVVSVVALLALVGVVAWVLLSRPSGSVQSNLSTATAAKRTINVTVSGSGSTVAANSVTVNPQISGTVKKLRVSLGQKVASGQTLYTISSDSVRTSLLQAKASLLQSKQGVSNASASYEKAEADLYNAKTQKIQAKKALDKAEGQPATATDRSYNIKIAARQYNSACESVDSAEIGVESADLGLQAAQANLKTARESYSTAVKDTRETVVSAPNDGVITALPISVGSAVSAGTNSSASSGGGSSSSSGGSTSANNSSSSSSSSGGSSITITDMASLQVELTVSEVDIPKVSVGQKATVEFDAISGKSFSGTVKSILPNATTSSGVVNYTVYIKLASVDSGLRTGMTATVDIETQHAANVLAVPSAAVKTSNGTKYVLVVGPGGQTTQKTVTVGVSDDSYMQILSGITEGTVVSTGSTGSSSSGSGSSSSSQKSGLMMGGGMGGPPGGGPGGN